MTKKTQKRSTASAGRRNAGNVRTRNELVAVLLVPSAAARNGLLALLASNGLRPPSSGLLSLCVSDVDLATHSIHLVPPPDASAQNGVSGSVPSDEVCGSG